jgi:undecaprenyl-diphosphatase
VTTRSLAAALAVSTAVFWALAGAYLDGGAVVELDEDVSAWVADEMPAWAEWIARPFSWLGGWIGVVVLLALVTGELARRRRYGSALLVVAVIAGVQLLTLAAKEGFGRERPDGGTPVTLPGSPSFPSGHASTAGAFFGLLTLLAAAAAPTARRRAAALALGAFVIVGIAGSRVVLNVHFVSDALAGLALGTAWLAACLLGAAAARARGAEAGPRGASGAGRGGNGGTRLLELVE